MPAARCDWHGEWTAGLRGGGSAGHRLADAGSTAADDCEEGRPAPGEVRVPLGGGLPAARMGRGESAGRRCTIRLRRRSTLTSGSSTGSLGRRAPRRMIWPERERDRRRQHPYSRRGTSRIFSLLNISAEEAKLRFGFFLEALEYGTPPHGGIALGLDRLPRCSRTRARSARSSFPKTATAVDMMSDAPSVSILEAVAGIALQIRRREQIPKHVKKIPLPQEGIETLYGAHDGNLKHIESLLGVTIRPTVTSSSSKARKRRSSASSASSISSRA